jgi:hypothetical protein
MGEALFWGVCWGRSIRITPRCAVLPLLQNDSRLWLQSLAGRTNFSISLREKLHLDGVRQGYRALSRGFMTMYNARRITTNMYKYGDRHSRSITHLQSIEQSSDTPVYSPSSRRFMSLTHTQPANLGIGCLLYIRRQLVALDAELHLRNVTHQHTSSHSKRRQREYTHLVRTSLQKLPRFQTNPHLQQRDIPLLDTLPQRLPPTLTPQLPQNRQRALKKVQVRI